MLQLARAIVWVASDVLRLVVSLLRSSSAIRAENLVLRRQLARYIERGRMRPQPLLAATSAILAMALARFPGMTARELVRCMSASCSYSLNPSSAHLRG
jgi:hypothetical protein